MIKHQYHPDEEYLPPNDVQPDGAPVWVFVFPSTFGGQHSTDHSLARAAHTFFDATPGSAHGRQGRSYAIMTYLSSSEATTFKQIQTAVEKFLQYAEHRKQAGEQFWIPSLMLAPITFSQLGPLFSNAPSNVSFPASWAMYLEASCVSDTQNSYVIQAYTTAEHAATLQTLGQHTDICL